MWTEPIFAAGGVFALTPVDRIPPGFETIDGPSAAMLMHAWALRASDIAEVESFVHPLRLVRRVEVRPPLDDIDPPADLADLVPSDIPTDEAEHWIEVRVLDEAHNPLAGVDLDLVLPDGKGTSGATDSSGALYLDGLFKGGSCKVDFRDLHEMLSEPMSLGTDRVHTVIVPGLLFVQLSLLDFEMQSVAGTACTLELEGTAYQGMTDGEGAVTFRVSAAYAESSGQLSAETEALGHPGPRPLSVAPLAPPSDPRGQRERLDNLGYIPADAQPDDPPSQYAVEEFQCDHGLPVTGACDAATQGKLAEVHGH